MDDFAAFLLYGLQQDEWAGGFHARLFLEVPLGRDEQVFVGVWFALGDRPGPIIFLLKERATRMGQKNLKGSILNAVHQQTGAESGHGLPISIWR